MPVRGDGTPVVGPGPGVYKRDPGGNFESDAHRRLLAVIWHDESSSGEDIVRRLDLDPHVPLGSDEDHSGVLKDLIEGGYVTQDQSGYKRTDLGFKVLTAPPVEYTNGDGTLR